MNDLIEVVDSCPQCGGVVGVWKSTSEMYRCRCNIDDDFKKEYWAEEDDSNKVFSKKMLDELTKKVEDKVREMLDEVKSGKKRLVLNKLTTLPIPEAAAKSFKEEDYLFETTPREIPNLGKMYTALKMTGDNVVMVLLTTEVRNFLLS